MKFDTEGTYTLQYKAVDECGNETVEDREVIVLPPPRTVLYTDGTLIINELPEDRANNIATHGEATNTYIPFDPNGATDIEKYIFEGTSDCLWYGQREAITTCIVGAEIHPATARYWFNVLDKCTEFDLNSLYTENISDFSNMFTGCVSARTISVENFDTSQATTMGYMFSSCRALTAIDVSNFVTDEVANFSGMFKGCSSIAELDLSSFSSRSATAAPNMFDGCSALTTIYATPNFDLSRVASGRAMFTSCNLLVGGSGSAFTSYGNINTYARIDNPPDEPGYFTLKQA